MGPEQLVVCQLPRDALVPGWALGDEFSSVTRTSEELSIVCNESDIPAGIGKDIRIETGWIALQLEGPFPFSMTGVLASFLDPLAAAHVPLFAVSTFHTDYILIKRDHLDAALRALGDAGHRLSSAS